MKTYLTQNIEIILTLIGDGKRQIEATREGKKHSNRPFTIESNENQRVDISELPEC